VPPPAAAAPGVVIEHDRDRCNLWVEARWTR
jgi:hypothetical protein